MTAIKLDLGGGRAPKAGFLNVDKWTACNPDVLVDFEADPLPYADSTVDEMNAHHVFEHLDFVNVPLVIAECYRVLKPGSGFRVTVPDLTYACQKFLDGNENLARMMIYAGHTDNDYDWHKNGYSTAGLSKLLTDAGFTIEKIEYPEWYGQNIDVWCVK